MNAKQLDITEALLAWPRAKEFLRPAIVGDDPERLLREIESKVATGIHGLWELQDDDGETVAFAISILYTTTGQVITAQLHIAAANGLEALLQQLPIFESWAMQNGVDRIEVIGRKGWARVLEPHGFSLDHVSLIKRVTKGMH